MRDWERADDQPVASDVQTRLVAEKGTKAVEKPKDETPLFDAAMKDGRKYIQGRLRHPSGYTRDRVLKVPNKVRGQLPSPASRQLSHTKAATSSPSFSSNKPVPHSLPRKSHYPKNTDSLRRLERALTQQYAREYLWRHSSNKSPNPVFTCHSLARASWDQTCRRRDSVA